MRPDSVPQYMSTALSVFCVAASPGLASISHTDKFYWMSTSASASLSDPPATPVLVQFKSACFHNPSPPPALVHWGLQSAALLRQCAHSIHQAAAFPAGQMDGSQRASLVLWGLWQPHHGDNSGDRGGDPHQPGGWVIMPRGGLQC